MNINNVQIDPINDNVYFISDKSGYNEIWVSYNNINEQITEFKSNVVEFILFKDSSKILLGIEESGSENSTWFVLTIKDNKCIKFEFPKNGFWFPLKQLNDKWIFTLVDNTYKNYCTYKIDYTSKEYSIISDNEVVFITDDFKYYVEEEELSFGCYNYFLNNGEKKVKISHKTRIVDIITSKNGFFFIEEDSINQKLIYVRLENYSRNIIEVFTDCELKKLEYDYVHDKLYIVVENGVTDKLLTYNFFSDDLRHVNYPGTVIKEILFHKNINLLCSSEDGLSELYLLNDVNNWERRITNEHSNTEKTIKSKVINYTTHDNLIIEALFYKSPRENGYTIVWIHGGPSEHCKQIHVEEFQTLLKLGFNIFAPNFRGSSGYGVSFKKLPIKKWGIDPKKDVLYGINYLKSECLIKNDSKFVMFGESYGGYLSLLMACQYPELVTAAINMFGPTDLSEFINTAPKEWSDQIKKEMLNTTYEDLRQISPITYIDQLNVPVCIIYGKNDPRVSYKSLNSFIEILEEQNKKHVKLCLSEQGHGYNNANSSNEVFEILYSFISSYCNIFEEISYE